MTSQEILDSLKQINSLVGSLACELGHTQIAEHLEDAESDVDWAILAAEREIENGR